MPVGRWLGLLLCVFGSAGCSAASSYGFNPDLEAFDASSDAYGINRGPDVVDAGQANLDKGNALCQANQFSCFPDDDRSARCALDAGADAAQGYSACRVSELGFEPACRAAGTKGENQNCTMPSDCAPGFECVGSPPACRHYCCDADTCASYTKNNASNGKQFFCDVQPLASNGKQKVPVCQAVTPCNLYHTLLGQDDCGPNLQCALVEVTGQLTTSCVAVGTKKVGDPCEQDHCGPKLQCVGAPSKCSQLCDPKMPICGQGQTCWHQSPILDQQGVGVCQ